MCWVMPPASRATTLVCLMASSSLVLPWSTWPMTVTTGGRGLQVGVLALVLAELDVEGLQQLPVLFLGGDDLDVVVELGAEQLQGLVVHRLGGGHHLAEVEEHLDERGRVHPDLVGEVAQRRAPGQPDDLAVPARDLARRRSRAPACCRTPGAAASSTCGRATGARRDARTRPGCRCGRGRRRAGPPPPPTPGRGPPPAPPRGPAHRRRGRRGPRRARAGARAAGATAAGAAGAAAAGAAGAAAAAAAGARRHAARARPRAAGTRATGPAACRPGWDGRARPPRAAGRPAGPAAGAAAGSGRAGLAGAGRPARGRAPCRSRSG